MPLYTFLCRNGHQLDRIVSHGTETIPCKECGDDSIRTYNESIGYRRDHTVHP